MKTPLAAFGLMVLTAPSFGGYGFVWANDKTAAPLASYVPTLAYQYNSSGHANTVIRYWAGYYEVRMPGVMQAGRNGSVQVTAYGNDDAYCKLHLFERRAAADLSAFVRCFTGGGSPVDSRFTIAYFDEQIDPVDIAYVRFINPRSGWTGFIFRPEEQDFYNARSPGDSLGNLHFWQVYPRVITYIHGWPETEANVLVTSLGGSSNRCAVTDIDHEGGTVERPDPELARNGFWVLCVRPVEEPVWDGFTLAYFNDRTLGAAGAYLAARGDETEVWRLPPPNRSANSFGGPNQVRRESVGVYLARLGNLAGRYSRSTALVTAIDGFDAWCKVRNWSASANARDVDVIVACYKGAGGQPAASGFFLHFATTP